MSNKSIKLPDTIRALNEMCPVSMAIHVQAHRFVV